MLRRVGDAAALEHHRVMPSLGSDRESAGVAASAHYVGHRHRDVSGGWLRPAVFGAMDGLVTNVSLIAGVGGGGGARHTIILTGVAGLVAGAFSMATGEYASVTSQNEAVAAEVAIERLELERHPEAEIEELAQSYEARGVSRATAMAFVRELSQRPDEALRSHSQQELGVDPGGLASAWTAAISSFACFGVGALLPLLPFLFGTSSLVVSLAVSAVALAVAGALVARVTSRSPVFSALRQLALGFFAVAVTYAVGRLVGSQVS